MRWDDLGITSDGQLRQIAAKMGLPEIQYIGFAEDMQTLPKGLSIINLGDRRISGTHWTMLWVEDDYLIYFDSYGVGPEDNIIALAGNRRISHNTKQVQRYEEEHCGIWVLCAAKAIAKKKHKATALNQFLNEFAAV